jgi:hypothetical protein
VQLPRARCSGLQRAVLGLYQASASFPVLQLELKLVPPDLQDGGASRFKHARCAWPSIAAGSC